MSTDRYFTYRGDVKAAVALGGTLVFTTVHPEKQPTGLFRLEADKLTLASDALPAGAVALLADGEVIWAAGSDGRVYCASVKGETPTVFGPPFSSPPVAFALLSEARLAVLAGAQITILTRKDGKVRQTLELPDPGACLAADPTGQWLVAGTGKGVVSVFDGEGKDEFVLSESAKLHEGAVTALLFEREELRFLSAGADNKLLSTHARGKLEPDDRGRGANHTDWITALIWGPSDRFFSGSKDSSVKTWPRAGAARPATQKDNVGKVVALAILTIDEKPHLVVACDDNLLRFFLLDEEGKFGDLTHKIYNATVWATNELAQDDPRRRETALRTLAGWNDTPSIEVIAEQIGKDGDHGLRLLATRLLADSGHPRAAKLLEKVLNHSDEAVRVAAFQGLRKHLGEQDLRPLDLALQTGKADVGKLAVAALEKLASRDDQALARLLSALDSGTPEVRRAALTSLENVHDSASPEANLLGLNSRHADVRRLALIRLFQRKLLQQAGVQAALRRRAEDSDPEVRRTAYLLSLYTRDRLVKTMRSRNPELNRQLVELESLGQGELPKEDATPSAQRSEEPVFTKIASQIKELTRRLVVGPYDPADLAEADYDPLLQATASRALDTCLRGASGLATLRDPRALGVLLQLSRAEDASARVWVCRALAALDDPRSVQRLRSLLYDSDAAVRDSAFTALAHLHQQVPLLAAEAGLNAAFEDVRQRGLQVLLQAVRSAPPRRAAEPAWQLLVRALNDSFPSVRQEAFKAALNLQVAGGGIQTYRFVLQSVHADVRREVLTEMMAQADEPWAWNLLLEFFNDHDPKLRQEAFAFAGKKTKELAPLELALASQYADIRKQAVDALIKKQTAEAQALLVKALADNEKEVRQLALGSLVGADARDAILQALKSPHADVRVRAAKALAHHGDAASLPPLLALAGAPEPQEKERHDDWAALVVEALDGLADLGDTAALPVVLPLLNSQRDAIRRAAVTALMWVSRPHSLEALRQALQHADPQVKYQAAAGLAYLGDPLVASLVFSEPARQVVPGEARLVAALTLGVAGENQLVVFLDDEDEALRNRALLLHMLLELKAHDGTPARCLACLSSRMPRLRLTAARALESFASPATFLSFVEELFNDRGEEQAWKIPSEVVDTVAELVTFAAPQTRARTALLMRTLAEKEQDAWNQAWEVHSQRFAGEIAELRRQAGERRPTPLQYSAESLRELAFGAYVGLVREQGGTPAARSGPQIIRVRQTALSRILALTTAEARYARAAQPVLVQALGDPNQAVRLQAFEHLQTLGMDPTALGAEALATGHTDLGVQGLKLLSGGASSAQGQAVLEQAMLTRKDDLALEAAKLLMEHRGTVPVAAPALEAAHERLRTQAVAWLAAAYDKEPASRDQLRQALNSRYSKVREAVTFELATKKDTAAFDALVTLLKNTQEAVPQRRVIAAMNTLGDPRTPAAFLDRIETDPSGTAVVDFLLDSVGRFRRPEVVDRLLRMGEKAAWAKAFPAVRVISGFDQRVEDPEDDRPDRRWEEKQFPRRTELLARLLQKGLDLGATRLLLELMPSARWARGKEVDPVLPLVAAQTDDKLRQAAVEAVGWRLRKRGGPADALFKALQHKDSVTQFLAAEGLAKAGKAEGLNVLLSSIEFLSELSLRQRAVRALGELADLRALDALLKLANDATHVLQQVAAEAVGHLGQSDKAEEIFKLLERFAKGQSALAAFAMRGLRWLNTYTGWQLIRQRAADTTCSVRQTAVEMLGYNDDPASRDLLIRLLSGDSNMSAVQMALTSARRVWGKESLDPDYALLQNSRAFDATVADPLKRVCEGGEARRLFELMPKILAKRQDALASSLLHRSTLPVEEAQASLSGLDERTVQLAAQILGRAGTTAQKVGPTLQGVLVKWRQEWEERRQKVAQTNQRDDRLETKITPCVRSLLWAAGRLGVAQDVLLEAAAARADDPLYRLLRLEAVAALESGKKSEAVIAALEAAAQGNDAEIRTLAADTLGRLDAKRAAKLAERLLSDRVSFNRLTSIKGVQVNAALRSAAQQIHYQGVALPGLLAQGDLEALSAVAENGKLPEATRLGAVEGLAKLAQDKAEAILRRIGQAQKEDAELRKAAWRALRRSQRARQQAEKAEVQA
jgi:ParB family chromosome partitioning protein